MSQTLLLSPTSRYKDTDVFLDENGVAQFGLFRIPKELDDLSDASTEALSIGDAPLLDGAAISNYGGGYEAAWWMIALASGIVDLERDCPPGVKLTVPPYEKLTQFVARDSDAG